MILNFGDIISHREVKYVFLGATTNFVYLARILDNRDPYISIIESRYSSLNARGDHKRTKEQIYYFVILSTEEMEGCMALLVKNEHEPTTITTPTILCKLNEADRTELCQMILEEGAPVNSELRKLIQQIH